MTEPHLTVSDRQAESRRFAVTRLAPSRSTRRAIVVCTIVFCAIVIGYVVALGDPANSLHQSALSWAFTLAGATLGSYIFGSVWDNQATLGAMK